MNIYDLISRAQKLRKETQLDSVSPDRVGSLQEDTLKYINESQLLASSPSLHKIYASVSAMQSDGAPKSDLTGKPLKPGQLGVIVPESQTDATAGDVYRYDGPSGNTSAWTFVAKIGAVPADAELSAISTNPPQNKVVTEKLTELESEVDLYKPLGFVNVKWLSSRGLIWSHTGVYGSTPAGDTYASDFIAIDDADSLIFTILRTETQSAVGCAFYSSDKSFISGIPANTGDSLGYDVVTMKKPHGASYMRVTKWAEDMDTKEKEFYIIANGILNATESKISALKEDVTILSNLSKAEDFELGNINISGSYWGYVASQTRVRTKQGLTYSLHQGDVIRLTDYSNARYYLGWHTAKGVYNSRGWLTSDYVVSEDAEYIILLCNSSDQAQSDKYALFNLLRIEQKSLVKERLEELESETNTKIAELEKIINDKSNTRGISTFVKGINHRGYNLSAPENTIPAYELSLEKGFKYVECDVSFTSDNIPVLLHDDTIDRTSNGTGKISEMTYAEVSQYDFGSWFSANFVGTKIPTLAEFLVFCRNNALHPYIELKSALSAEQISLIIKMVSAYGMRGKVSYISFSYEALEGFKESDAMARLGYVVNSPTDTSVDLAGLLRSGYNDVFLNAGTYTTEIIQRCILRGIPLELWTINSVDEMNTLDSYISGVSSDIYNYEDIVA